MHAKNDEEDPVSSKAKRGAPERLTVRARLYLRVLHARVLPRLGDVAVVPEDGAVVKPKLAVLGVLPKEQQVLYKTDRRTCREEIWLSRNL